MKKIDRALYGPGLGEIIFGAALSVLLGAALGFVYLVSRPVATVKEIPKDAPANAVYYIPGNRSGTNTSALSSKRKMFVSGASITLSEEELNSFASAERPPAPSKPKPAAGAKPDAAAPQSDFWTVGTANIRIRDAEMQVVVPVKISAFGFDQEILVQTRGRFVRQDAGFVYDPAKLWIGGCPAGRLPGATRFVEKKILLPKPLPEDVAAAWAKLADVAIAGTNLRLTMP